MLRIFPRECFTVLNLGGVTKKGYGVPGCANL